MEVDELYQVFLDSKGVSTDSRTIQPGEIFFALRGQNFNGNEHATQALQKGAHAAVVDDPSNAIGEDYILVKKVLSTLQSLARYHRQQLQIPVIGITGSNGKTTTKELIKAVLSAKYLVSSTQGNYNNHIGVPLTILNADRDAEILIVEMGTNQPGDIGLLCSIASPTHGLITNIGSAHLEKLKNREGIFSEKMRLFESVKERAGTIFINQSDQYLKNYNHTIEKKIPYHEEGFGNTQITMVGSDDTFLNLQITDSNIVYDLRSGLVGKYNHVNISAALCVGVYFGIEMPAAIQSIGNYYPHNMRSQLIRTERNVLFVDAYNANPSSMEMSISSFLERNASYKTLILGDMLELGTQSEKYHQRILDMPELQNVQKLFLVGSLFCEYSNEEKSFKNVYKLIESGELEKLNNSNILIKGSRGIKLEKVISYL